MEGMENAGASASLMDRLLRAVKLDPVFYREVAKDDTKTTEAMLVVFLANLIGGLGAIFGPTRFRFFGWIVGAIVAATIGLAIGAGILWLLGKLFGGKAEFLEMFRPLGYATAPGALGIIPVIGSFIGSIWSIACAVIAVRESEEVSTGAAVAIVLIPVVIVLVLVLLAGVALLATLGFGANS